MTNVSKFAFAACAGLMLLGSAGVFSAAKAQPEKQLNVFIWSQYISRGIVRQFERKYHVTVTVSNYGSLPEMFAKLRAGGDRQFDIIVPSSYYIERLVKANLVQPLDHALIPNLKNLMPQFKSARFDPGNRYSAAYQWGTTGIAYNTRRLRNVPQSWAIVFDPKVNPKYPFVVQDNPEVTLGSACAYLGYGYPCKNDQEYRAAAKLMIATMKRPNFAGFMDGTPCLDALARGTVSVGITFNGDLMKDKLDNPKGFADVKYIAPAQGSELWVDVMAIPSHAPHPRLANEFINFMLGAEVGAELSNYNRYATPNRASLPLLRKDMRVPIIFPTDAQLKHYHYSPALKGHELQFVQQLWTAVRASQ